MAYRCHETVKRKLERRHSEDIAIHPELPNVKLPIETIGETWVFLV